MNTIKSNKREREKKLVLNLQGGKLIKEAKIKQIILDTLKHNQC